MSAAHSQAQSTLVRVGARAWGVATGLVLGGGLFAATLVLVLKGGVDQGSHLGRLSQVLPGYSVSTGGAFIGFFYAFVIGYALGRVLAPRKQVAVASLRTSRGKHVRLNGGAWGLATGALLGVLIFATTAVLALRGGSDVGPFLSQLGIYFPGYEVTLTGGLIGALWLFGLGYVFGRSLGAIYNRAVEVAER